jgi:hypothetical protein
MPLSTKSLRFPVIPVSGGMSAPTVEDTEGKVNPAVGRGGELR